MSVERPFDIEDQNFKEIENNLLIEQILSSASISEQNRQLLKLRLMEHKSLEEVAGELGLDARTINHKEKALLKLLYNHTANNKLLGDKFKYPDKPGQVKKGRIKI